MGFIQGGDRHQLQMLSLDDMVSATSIVRIIDKFIDGLDFASLGFDVAENTGAGRSPYHPKAMAKILLFGYYEDIRSSRKLEKACKTNVEMIWLASQLAPDHKTIANFRKDNLLAIQNLFDEFGSFTEYKTLVGKGILALDGTKMRASNSKKRMLTLRKLKRQAKHHSERVKDYLKALEQTDDGDTLEQVTAHIDHHEKQIESIEHQIEDLKQAECSERALSDPDARNMGDKSTGVRPSYNLQTMVDAKEHLVVSFDIKQTADDHGHIASMAKDAAMRLRTTGFSVIADKGYWGHADIEACRRVGIDAIIAPQGKAFAHDDTRIAMSRFDYDATTDSYLCPQGNILNAHSKKASAVRIFYNKSACAICELAPQCCPENKSYRVIRRQAYSDVLEDAARHYEQNKDTYALRQQTVEHVFGTIKRAMGADHFLLRGKEKVKTEASLLFLAYNIKRTRNALGFEEMMGALDSYFELLKEHLVALLAYICIAIKTSIGVMKTRLACVA